MKYSRVARKFLKGKVVGTSAGTIARQRSTFESSHTLVRVYYGVTLYLLVERLGWWSRGLALQEIFPSWPLAWVQLIGIPMAVHVIMAVFLIAALLSTLFPDKRVFRALLFVSLLEFVAFSRSFENSGLTWHSWLGIGFFFIFLPDGKREQLQGSITKRQLYLTTFWAAQALVLGFYSLAGFWKVAMGVYQLLKGEMHAFAVDAFAYEIARIFLQTNRTPPMISQFLIEHPLVGWPMYLSHIYLQLFAFVVAFRPSLHRLWGISLIGFHLGSYFVMSIGFNLNVLLLALFLVGSPFVDAKHSWRTVLYDLPLIGWIVTRTLSWRPFSSPRESPVPSVREVL